MITLKDVARRLMAEESALSARTRFVSQFLADDPAGRLCGQRAGPR